MQFDEWYVIRVKKVERQSAWDEHGCQMGITTMDIQVLPDGHYYEYTRIIEKHPELKEGGWRKNFLTKQRHCQGTLSLCIPPQEWVVCHWLAQGQALDRYDLH